jgi:hypothetical protein
VDADRLALVAQAIASSDAITAMDRLCEVSVGLFDVTGAGVAIVGDGQHLGALAASDALIASVDDLQFQLGEGPCLEADRTGGPVLAPDLGAALGRWPAFSVAAVAQGVSAVFAFPLQIGSIRHGVLSLYRTIPGALSSRDEVDAITVARIATHVLLDLNAATVPGDLPSRLDEVGDHRAHVHQATGMIAAQLETDVGNALSRLRAHAWAHSRSIDDVAAEVVGLRLRFDATE